MENYSEKKQYENLSAEQNEVLQEVNDLISFKEDDPDRLEKFMSRQKAAMDFEHKMQAEGIEPKDYILFHRIISSTPFDGISEFDTPTKQIEKFIRDFYFEFELKKKQK